MSRTIESTTGFRAEGVETNIETTVGLIIRHGNETES